MGDVGWVESSFKRPNTCVTAVCLPREDVGPQHFFTVLQEAPLSFYLPDCTQRKDRQECCRTSESLPSLSDGVWLGIGQPADNSIPK